MRITQGGDQGDSALVQTITDYSMKVFQISVVTTLGLAAWLIWGLVSGRMAGVAMSAASVQAALNTVGTVSLWLNVSLAFLLISSVICFYDRDELPVVLLLAAAFFAFGLRYAIDFFTPGMASVGSGRVSEAALRQLYRMAVAIAVPGVLLFIRSLFMRITDSRYREDLSSPMYGKDIAPQEDVPKATIGAFAKCWQLPFCREGVRKTCPIYHGRTKCWKERVGCMCEENIIRLSMTSDAPSAPPTVEMQKNQGFVAIGDLISNSEKAAKANIPTRPGPRGVRIPTNPNLTEAQKRQRCHNCIIYNEHQRQKYQLLAPLVTLLAPLLVWWQFEPLRDLLRVALRGIDSVLGRLSLDQQASVRFAESVTGMVSVEVVLLVCFTLVLMTWALRFLEFCMFKLKI